VGGTDLNLLCKKITQFTTDKITSNSPLYHLLTDELGDNTGDFISRKIAANWTNAA
jgi:hypothetical protein